MRNFYIDKTPHFDYLNLISNVPNTEYYEGYYLIHVTELPNNLYLYSTAIYLDDNLEDLKNLLLSHEKNA